jgi:hypothetical protein
MFLTQLFESAGQVGIIFGRFNPPHQGHKAAWEMASKAGTWYVGTNQNTVGPKDPLPYKIKIQAMETVWSEVQGHILPETSWLTMASAVYQKHGAVTLLCYTDEEWVVKTLVQYNGKEGAHGLYKFPAIKQQTTPRLSSATALRDAVVAGNREAFAKAAGVSADTPVAGKAYFDLVAEYLLPYANAPKKVKKVKEPAESQYGMAGVGMGNYGQMEETVLRDKEDLQAKRKALQDIQMDKDTHKDPELAAALVRRKDDLEKEAERKGINEDNHLADALAAREYISAGDNYGYQQFLKKLRQAHGLEYSQEVHRIASGFNKPTKEAYKYQAPKAGANNPDDVHVPIKGDEPVKRGDAVVVQDPHDLSKVHSGIVKRVGRTFVFITLKDGSELAVPHDEVSKHYSVLSARADAIQKKQAKQVPMHEWAGTVDKLVKLLESK